MEVSLKFLVALHPGLLFGCLLRAARLFEKSAGGLSPPRDTIGEIISNHAKARHVFNLSYKKPGLFILNVVLSTKTMLNCIEPTFQ